MTFADRVAAEIIGLHQFLEEWFTARVPRTDESFGRLSRAWRPPLLLLSPTNELLSASALLETTMAQYGEFPALSIEIRDLRVTTECAAGAAVAIYEEWHIEDGQSPDVRLCSATFIEDPARPNSVRWMHVHESRLNVS